MSSVNKVLLIGNVGRDPEVRYTTTGRAVGSFTLATSSKYGDPPQESTEWHNIVVWGREAELAQQYIRKGRQLYVEGRLQTRDWTDQQGAKHWKTEVVCTRFLLLGRRDDAPQDDQQADGPAPGVAFNDFDNSEYDAPLPPLSHGD